MKHIAHLYFLYALLVASQSIAQTCEGIVVDEQSNEAIPFANILLRPSLSGTSANENGVFLIQVAQGDDTVEVSAIGYETKREKTIFGKKVTYRLRRTQYNLNEVVIGSGVDSVKMLMDRIVAQKVKHDPNQLPFYKKEVYNKVELDLSDFGSNFDSNFILQNFSFLLENIDTTTDIKPLLPVFLTESLSDFYYRKTPKAEKEIVRASRISGVSNESFSQFIGNFYQDFNMYENYLLLFGKNFVSPIADSWNYYYQMYLVDSAFIDDVWCYKLSFEPKRKQENVFRGDMWIADKDYAIKIISMEIDNNANINFLERVSLYQESVLINDSIWMLSKDKLIAEFKSMKRSAGIVGRKTATYRNFSFNLEDALPIFELTEEIIVNDGAMIVDEAFWQEARHEKLSDQEAKIYSLVDSVKSIPAFNSFIDILTAVVTGYLDLNYFEIGPYFKVVSNNQIEGLRLRLGIKTGDKLSERFTLGGYAAYGFDDKKVKYGGNFDFVIKPKPWQTIHAYYQNDLDINTLDPAEFGEDNLLSGLYRRKDVAQKLVALEEKSVYYERDFNYGISTTVFFKNELMVPYFDYLFVDENDNTIDSTIQNTEIALRLKFAYKEKFIVDGFQRISLGTLYPVVSLQYNAGIPDLLKSDFKYHSIELKITDRINVGNIGETYYEVRAGKIIGDLPLLLLHIPQGNETYFYSGSAFNLMNEYEFITDTYAEVIIAHHFFGFFLNKVPIVRYLKLREVITVKGVIGSLTNNNSIVNGYSTAKAPYYIGNTSPFPKPYVEIGVGLENILKVFRVDAIWRLTYLNQPLAPNFGIRLGMTLDI